MHKSRCPHCDFKLGNFLYADECPRCYEELEHNTRVLVPAPPPQPLKEKAWPLRWFLRLVRWAES